MRLDAARRVSMRLDAVPLLVQLFGEWDLLDLERDLGEEGWHMGHVDLLAQGSHGTPSRSHPIYRARHMTTSDTQE